MADYHVSGLVIIVRNQESLWPPGHRRGWTAELDLDGVESPMGYGYSDAWEAVRNLLLGLAMTGILDRCFRRLPAPEPAADEPVV